MKSGAKVESIHDNGVLSCDKFRMQKLDDAAIEEVFAPGDDHITSPFEMIRDYTDDW